MLRKTLSILTGFLLWTALWLGANAALFQLMPDSFGPDGTAGGTGILALTLVISVIISVVSGTVCALVARRDVMRSGLILGLLLLAVGIIVQIQYWTVMPLWYHLIFLSGLVPGTLLGARWQQSRSVKRRNNHADRTPRS